MALSSKEKVDRLRKKRLEIGLKRREFYLNDEETVKVKKFIKEKREKKESK